MNPAKLNIIIPTCNEKTDGYLIKMAASYPVNSQIQYIVIDSNTSNEVLQQVKRDDFIIRQQNQLKSRASKLSFGLKLAPADIILFHHPRSLIDSKAFFYLLRNDDKLQWGGFTHKMNADHLGLKWTSWYSNNIRPKMNNIIYLDHGIYFKKQLFDQELADIEIFEDTEISKILAKHAKPKILNFISETSAIRFQKNGFWKQALLNQILKVAYNLGASDKFMNKFYEKGLSLNGNKDPM